MRPAVFGVMDGLVSNFALVAGVAGGVAGAGGDTGAVVLAGMAGLAAGAFSMAAGEYTSVASQSELARGELALERQALAGTPKLEQEELAQRYIERGVEVGVAREVARQLSRDPEQALSVHARDELGVDPGDLPSPLLAAVASFLAFTAGALLPVLPYLLGAANLLPALVVSGVGLFGAGALVSLVTVSSWWWTGSRQLLLGGVAAALTYAVGMLVGSGIT
ncbi:VIT1/CCC1 family predicted Fe2+/Mn2+ transporter [Actinomycetospora cinnamomea]|uniref:VIT1/CCC1 family predicted Fe2+/Mn2+ transporter n=1 Tax=Actinomycetospora cinnamomea TaxID=663609 RepID=A0A2U1FAC7_9PSEU|nr:VIT1/CCC1 family predicted Fe2+/Mn2+ transporter [Actinomycetospora cinnamomea]